MTRAVLRGHFATAGALFAVVVAVSAVAPASAQQGTAPATVESPGRGAQGGRGGGAFVAYPPRATGDPAAIERGKTQWGVHCTFCHGPDARGGDGGGPNLLRSSAMLDDQNGELIGPIVQKGRGAMPAMPLSNEQLADIAAFLHSFPVSSRTGPSTLDILVGDAKKGEAYVAQACARCHTIEALRTFARKLDDSRALQQMWLMPGSGGRGFVPNTAPIPRPPITGARNHAYRRTCRGAGRSHRRLHCHASPGRWAAAHDQDVWDEGPRRAARSASRPQGTSPDLYRQRHP